VLNYRGGRFLLSLRTCGSRAEGFSDLIKTWWKEEEVQGFASYVVARKLKVVKVELKTWNKDVFGYIKVRKYNLLNSVNALDKKEESGGLSVGLSVVEIE